MDNKTLDRALARLKKAREVIAQARKEYDSARAEWQPLAQAKKKVNETKRKYDTAIEKWNTLSEQFDDEHNQLIEHVSSARNALYEAEERVEKIINKLTGVNNE